MRTSRSIYILNDLSKKSILQSDLSKSQNVFYSSFGYILETQYLE
jgi:hypothetical protein